MMIFSLNYDVDLSKVLMPADSSSPIARLSWTKFSEMVWSLVLLEECRDLKGLWLRAGIPAGAVVAVTPGDLLAEQAEPCFLQNIPAHGLDLGLALLNEIRAHAAGRPPSDDVTILTITRRRAG